MTASDGPSGYIVRGRTFSGSCIYPSSEGCSQCTIRASPASTPCRPPSRVRAGCNRQHPQPSPPGAHNGIIVGTSCSCFPCECLGDSWCLCLLSSIGRSPSSGHSLGRRAIRLRGFHSKKRPFAEELHRAQPRGSRARRADFVSSSFMTFEASSLRGNRPVRSLRCLFRTHGGIWRNVR